MRKHQSSSQQNNDDGTSDGNHEKAVERSPSHHSSNNGTPIKKSENGGANQRHHYKMYLVDVPSPTSGNGNASNGDKPKALVLELVIHKDKNGYGMKVSGENPVFVDSVKDGGAAYRAGLHAADMILRVNGHNVRFSSHAEVVQLMKATQNVELTVQRRNTGNFSLPLSVGGNTKACSSSTTSSGAGTPTTPTSQRNSITAPLPVDHVKRKEVEYTKLHTLYMMLEQERKNLEKLRENETQNATEISRAEVNIRTLEEQLRQSTIEGSSASMMNIITSASSKLTATSTTSQAQLTGSQVPFLARFPRSLSQLNIGSKRKSSAPATATSPQETQRPLPASPPTPTSSSTSSSATISAHSTPIASPSHQKVRIRHQHPTVTADVPPPLPQRNAPRKSLPASPVQISDLDASLMAAVAAGGSPSTAHVPAGAKKKHKTKIKAWSDPKMSSQMMLQMEVASYPPPLPPRTGLILDDGNGAFGQVISNKDSADGSPSNDGRPLPNSCSTQLQYPLITTCVTVRDGLIAPAPPSGHFHHNSFEGVMNTSSTSLPLPGDMMPPMKTKKDKLQRDGSGPEVSPPGTPPPPYHANSTPISAAQTNVEQRQIMSFEYDNETDDEGLAEDNGVYRSISLLTAPENIPYLVVFLNFVLSNSKPAAILFYLITDLYKKGNVKDMRKWAYEIHSTFLVPTAPLYLSFFPEAEAQAEALARDIDDKLAQTKNYQPQEKTQQDFEMGGLLRSIFQKSRAKARDIINLQMEEFQEKRTAGLGTMYGPPAGELQQAKGNKQVEQRIVEEHLMPKLQQYLDVLEKDDADDEKMALASALSTVVHRIFLPRGGATAGTERVHHYVAREKSFKSRLISKNRKSQVRGHHLSLKQYYETTHCNHCQNLMWGVSPQGFSCTDCGLNVHRGCAKSLEETCPGPVNVPVDRFTKLMDRIREKGGHGSGTKKQEEDLGLSIDDAITSDRSASFSARPKADIQHQRPTHTSSSTSQLISHDTGQSEFHHGNGSSGNISGAIGGSAGVLSGSPSTASSGLMGCSMEGTFTDGHSNALDGRRGKPKTSQPNARSESYKECSPKRSRTNRPKSDPSLGLYEDDVTSSSLDQPDELVNASTSTAGQRPGTSQDSSPASSDDESSRDLEPNLSATLTAEIMQQLTDAERKRQEIINELFETEKNHVKILKVLQNVFMVPLESSRAMSPELIQLVFPPSLGVLKDWHNVLEASLKQRWKEHNGVVKEIGDCLMVFEGESGETLREHAARFCARQQIALEVLKERRKKDENLQRGLIKAESHKACRRLQLKDLLPAVLQRLTKYPLLFERLHKISEGADAEAIKRAIDASKSILDYVNQAVRVAEELRSIQKKLDKSSYEKEAPNEFKNIDLTNYKLIREGLMTIKKGTIQLHVLLFDTMIVLLQKQDDKYVLKYFPNPSPCDSTLVNPITKISNTLVRLSAVDKRTFFLIDKEKSYMLELTAPSELESEMWIRVIAEAAEKANHLKKVHQKPSTIVPPIPPPPTLEETPEALLVAPPEEQPTNINEDSIPATEQTPSQDESNDTEVNAEEPEEEPKDDPNAISTTQPCQLIPPTEIHVIERPVLQADRVVMPEENLRRLGLQVQQEVTEMERIICDINKVPQEHFAEIADIAAQPEAPQDLADLGIATFAQTKYLVECIREALINSIRVAPSSIGGAALCDNCAPTVAEFRSRSASEPLAQIIGMEVEAETDADNLYCEIEPLKDDGVKIVSHMEINENYSGGEVTASANSNAGGTISINKIASSITTLNSLVAQLTIKIADRDQERDAYRRENQRLRQQLHLMQDTEIVGNAVRDLTTADCVDGCDGNNEQPEP